MGKYGPEKTPYLDNFHGVIFFVGKTNICNFFDDNTVMQKYIARHIRRLHIKILLK